MYGWHSKIYFHDDIEIILLGGLCTAVWDSEMNEISEGLVKSLVRKKTIKKNIYKEI
jgi:hypothetical protein